MIPKSNFCEVHPTCEIGGIYKELNNKQCPRKLCFECNVTLKIPPESILTKEILIQKISEKLNSLDINHLLKENVAKTILKRFQQQLDLFQAEIFQIFSSIQDSVNAISDEEKAEDEKFIKLINKDFNPFDCSNKELDFLINFIEGNIFDEWIQRKKILNSLLQKAELFLNSLIQSSYKTCFLFENIHMNLQEFIKNQYTKVQSEPIQQCVGLQKVKNKLEKIKFQIQKRKNGDIVYQKDGQILRIIKNTFDLKIDNLFDNLEQIKYLEFSGQKGVKEYKIKQWNYFWKGQLIGGGTYNLIGQKQGQWKELIKNFWDQKNIIEEGNYLEGIRNDVWNYIWNDQIIGGGAYDKQGKGLKTGEWIELSDDFSEESQVTFNGEYNQNGMKVGMWDTMYCNNNQKEYKQIGGGLYVESHNQESNTIKIGKWIELNEGFSQNSQVTYNREYNEKGQKKGRWDIMYSRNQYQKYNQIGGGLYEEKDGRHSIKIGTWVELCQDFKDENLVTYRGDYNQNGLKIGQWIIMANGGQLGQGQYKEQEGGSKKAGKWIEQWENFQVCQEIHYEGEYNSNGCKKGVWDIKFYGKKTGGGQYDDQEEVSKKIGSWIDLFDGFHKHAQVTFCGEYSEKGQKIGKRDTMAWGKKIGGGQYEEWEEGSRKIGSWIDIGDDYWFENLVTQSQKDYIFHQLSQI